MKKLQLNPDYQFQEYINSYDLLIENFEKSCINPLAEALDKNYSDSIIKGTESDFLTFSKYLDQLNYDTENFLNCITTQVLSVINVSKFNDYMQNIYDKTPNDTEINPNETELNIVQNVLSCIKSYNAIHDITTRIKMPVNKEKICSIFLFITIITILILSGYNIAEHIHSICESILANIVYNEITKKD